MTIRGYQFDKMQVTANADSILYHALNDNNNRVLKGFKNEMKVTASGLNIYIETGALLLFGRLIEITERHTLTVPANSSGYIVVTIDLTQYNEATGTIAAGDYTPLNNQLRLETVATLTKQDLNNDGKIYTYALASYIANGTTATIKNENERNLPVTFESNFANYSLAQKVTIERVGNMIHINGAVRNNVAFEAGLTAVTVLTLPEEARPDTTWNRPNWGSGRSTFLVSVNTDGTLQIGRYGVTSTYSEVTAGAWLNIGISFPAKGV